MRDASPPPQTTLPETGLPGPALPSSALPSSALPGFTPEALGRLMPMYLWVDAQGNIAGIGPTLAKSLDAGVPGQGAPGQGGAAQALIGSAFSAHFAFRLLHPTTDEADADPFVMARLPPVARRLHLSLRARPDLLLRGTSVSLGPQGDAGVFVNLSFGIHLAGAVRDLDLTEADFAASDLAIEMLYMGEANAAVLGELSALTGRLELARRTAVAQAQSDPLTGLANRRGFDLAIEAELRAFAEGGGHFAVAHLDLDYFKEVNDTFGHAAGDHVLMLVARRMAAELRRGDLVARTGGDEFLILLPGATDLAALSRLAERLIARLEEPCLFEGESFCVSASIGIAVSQGGGGVGEAERLLAEADRALYAAKRAGRGRCVFGPGLIAPARADETRPEGEGPS